MRKLVDLQSFLNLETISKYTIGEFTEWFMPHMNTLMKGSLARKSFHLGTMSFLERIFVVGFLSLTFFDDIIQS